jgi:site-specific DNA-cytosine methylase
VLNGISLFSGIGGFESALNLNTVAYVEREPYAQAVLLERAEEGLLDKAPIYDDIRGFRGEAYRGNVDAVFGGFPCQGISEAGLGRGLEDSRSGLWYEMLRVIREVRPSVAIVENVPAITRRGLPEVLWGLAEAGYDAIWDMYEAADVGAPHKRERFFLVAFPCGEPWRCGELFDGQDEIYPNLKWDSTKNIKSGSEWKRWLIEASQAVDGEVSEADFYGVDDGLPTKLDQSRIRCLGNAICPQQAEYAIKTMINELRDVNGKT